MRMVISSGREWVMTGKSKRKIFVVMEMFYILTLALVVDT